MDQIDWDKYNFPKYRANEPILFEDVFARYLKKNKSAKMLEIGCAGGLFLFHIFSKYQHQPHGIDFSDKIILTSQLFEKHDAPLPILYQADFSTWKPLLKFDLVMSFGFIEHFECPEKIIKKHVDLLTPGGLLIISIPHFAHVQYFWHWLIDRDNLKKHNVEIMNLKFFKKALYSLPVEIFELSYYGTFAFWTERNNLSFGERTINKIIQLFGRLLIFMIGNNCPNYLFSPHIICVARKKIY